MLLPPDIPTNPWAGRYTVPAGDPRETLRGQLGIQNCSDTETISLGDFLGTYRWGLLNNRGDVTA